MTIKEKIEELVDSNSQYIDKKEMIKFLLSLLGENEIKYKVCSTNTPITSPYYSYCITSVNEKEDIKMDTMTTSHFNSCDKFNNIPGNAIIQ